MISYAVPDKFEVEQFKPEEVLADLIESDSYVQYAITTQPNVATIHFKNGDRINNVGVLARLDDKHRRIFWLFAKCGIVSLVESKLVEIFTDNNSCLVSRITICHFDGKPYICCCESVFRDDDNWEIDLLTAAIRVSQLAQSLEAKWWQAKT